MTTFHNLPAIQIENDQVRVTVSVQGGHIAEVLNKKTGVNPLWTPPWPSIEFSTYSPQTHPEYGHDAESKLLAGILGHNLCLDLFGPPSPEEAAAGIIVHGETAEQHFEITQDKEHLTARVTLPIAQLNFARNIRLEGPKILIRETVENLSALDRPIAWTQHVTLGPPFIEKGRIELRTTATKSRTASGVDFEWPFLPAADGSRRDLQIYSNAESSGGYTTQLMDKRQEQAWFLARSPSSQSLVGYVWRRSEFPWLGIWEENRSRTNPPWNGRTLTWGLEFGVSPFPESRREMIDRNSLFDTPCYRWIPAKASVAVDYYCAIGQAKAIPNTLQEFERAIS